VFPNEKREFLAGWRAAQKTEGRAGGQHKKTIRRAAEKDGSSCRKEQPSGLPFSAARRPSVCSPLADPVVQPADLPFFAARQSAENSCFSIGNHCLNLRLS